MSKEHEGDQNWACVCFAVCGLDEASRLVAVAGLGMCDALTAGAVTPTYACQRLFGPALLTRLERAKACPELRDAIHRATELEDIAEIIPERLPGAVSDVRAKLLEVLRRVSGQDDSGDRWLVPTESAP